MQRRTTDTRKPSQNHASATHLNPFQTRPFGTDIAKKPETPTTDIDFDAQYEHAKSHAHNLANVPVMPPSTPNIQTKSSIENSIETQTTTNPTHQHIQRQTPGISVAKSLNVPTFQELQNRPEVEQQNIQSRPLVTPHWAAKPSNSVSPVQAKLTIGQPGDKYEQEADQVASQVVQQINTPASTQVTQGQSVQRQEEPVEELQAKPEISSLQRMEEPEEELQAKSIIQRREAIGGGEASIDLDTAINSSRGSGQSLDAGLQQSMGQVMGADFSGVKIHTDAQSDQLNRSIQARAFTTGQDVFFRQGAYEPGSRGGQELIAHELTHVVQQRGSNHEGNKNTLNMSSSIIQRELSKEQKKEFHPIIADFQKTVSDYLKSNVLSPHVIKGIKEDINVIIKGYTDTTTDYNNYVTLVDIFSEKLDMVKQYHDALVEAKAIFKEGLENRQAEEAAEKRIDTLDLIEYDQLKKITQEKGEHSIINLIELVRRWRKKEKPVVKSKTKEAPKLTAQEEIDEKSKEGPGSSFGFDVMKTRVEYYVKLYGEDFTYTDVARTEKKDKVRMYEIRWKENEKTKKQHSPWVLHIHFTLNDKVTVAHFKRYKTHNGGAGTNLSNYDGETARSMNKQMEDGLNKWNKKE